MRLPQPIPYQGSKRNLAEYILSFFPNTIDVLYEPFAGSAAVSVAAVFRNLVERVVINDINKPLMDLLFAIINDPAALSEKYRIYWNEQLNNEQKYYNYIRDRFNETKEPSYLLYLLARCVKAAVRYNSNGDFNQSPDNRRKGRNPDQMESDIFLTSGLLKGKTTIYSEDYKRILKIASYRDLIYMDPPYQGVVGTRDNRYYQGIEADEFIEQLDLLNRRKIRYIVSYDGRLGNKAYGKKLPDYLQLYHIELKVGRSSQATLNSQNHDTYESLYLSESLLQEIDPSRLSKKHDLKKSPQLNLFM